MFGWIKKSPKDKIEAQIRSKYEESVRLQRNGKLKEYGEVMAEIEQLETKLTELN
jgi:hypothetical protein